MKNPIDESYNFLINKWGGNEYKGRGVMHCVKPMDYTEIVYRVITLMQNKNPTVKIFIAVNEWDKRVKIFDKLKANNVNLEHISCVTKTYLNPKYTYSYNLCIEII